MYNERRNDVVLSEIYQRFELCNAGTIFVFHEIHVEQVKLNKRWNKTSVARSLVVARPKQLRAVREKIISARSKVFRKLLIIIFIQVEFFYDFNYKIVTANSRLAARFSIVRL